MWFGPGYLDESVNIVLNVDDHIEYFRKCLGVLPSMYTGLDTGRLSAVIFNKYC